MKSGIWIASIAALAAAVALGCGGSEEPTAASAPSAPSADAPAAADVAAPTPAEAPAPAGPVDPVAHCKNLAAEENWAVALEPCMKAAVAAPSDLAVRHALQQAQAAAEEGS